MGVKKTTKQFIIDAKKIHGNKFDYSLVEYIGCQKKIKIICYKGHIFEQTPNNHLSGYGCKECSMINLALKKIKSQEYVINQFKKVHGDTYDYSLVEYKNTDTKVKIKCKIHGIFEQKPDNHKQGHGCPECGGHMLKIQEHIIKEFKEVHGNKYDYSLVKYKNAKTKIKIKCKQGHTFEQLPGCHKKGYNCPVCSCHIQKTQEQVIKQFREIHGDKYDYSLVEYIGVDFKVKIKCKIHGIFNITPYHHYSREQGCPKCISNKISKKSIQYIEFLKVTIPHIQYFYSKNGEYKIKNSKYKADGYDNELNTIYEFHGDFWHGNPNRYNLNDMNCITKKTFRELFNDTKKKEKYCLDNGYKYKCVWETEWNNGIKAIKKLQKIFKNNAT